MRRFNRFGLIAVLAVAATAAPALAGTVTVGRFYTEIAKAKRISAVDAASAEAGLRAAGFSLPQLALDKSLTEGDMTSISKTLGIPVTTTRPSAFISESQMDQYVGTFSTQLGAGSMVGVGGGEPGNSTDSQGGDPGNSGNGHGKKKGHNKSTSEPM